MRFGGHTLANRVLVLYPLFEEKMAMIGEGGERRGRVDLSRRCSRI